MKNSTKDQQNKSKKQEQKRKSDDTYLVKAAQILVSEEVDLSIIPDSDLKEEFLQYAELAIQDKIKSLEKARLEFLSSKMEEFYFVEKNREENERRRKETQLIRQKKDKNRRLLRMKTKKGQPILKNLARIQYQQVRKMIESEQKQ